MPSIRPAVVVVIITITIGTLKVFDIVRTTTGGNFETSVRRQRDVQPGVPAQ